VSSVPRALRLYQMSLLHFLKVAVTLQKKTNFSVLEKYGYRNLEAYYTVYITGPVAIFLHG